MDVSGLSMTYHITMSSMCILPCRNRCAAANARAKRMASGGVTREPHIVASQALPSVTAYLAQALACPHVSQFTNARAPFGLGTLVSYRIMITCKRNFVHGRGASPKSQSTRSSSKPKIVHKYSHSLHHSP